MVLGSMVLMMGVRYGNLYKLLEITIFDEWSRSIVLGEGGTDEKTMIALGGKTMIWNQILEHIIEKGLQSLQGKGIVEGMTDCSLYFNLCKHCTYGKKNRVRFASGATRGSEIL